MVELQNCRMAEIEILWRPSGPSSSMSETPRKGSFEDLQERHPTTSLCNLCQTTVTCRAQIQFRGSLPYSSSCLLPLVLALRTSEKNLALFSLCSPFGYLQKLMIFPFEPSLLQINIPSFLSVRCLQHVLVHGAALPKLQNFSLPLFELLEFSPFLLPVKIPLDGSKPSGVPTTPFSERALRCLIIQIINTVVQICVQLDLVPLITTLWAQLFSHLYLFHCLLIHPYFTSFFRGYYQRQY